MESELCDALLHVVSNTPLGYSGVRGFIPHGTLHFFTGVQRVRCPCLRNGLLPLQHDGLWSRASHARRKLVRAVGLHPLPKLEPLYRSGQQEVHQHYWPEERGVAARLVNSRSGRTSRPGDPRPNPQGAGADRPYLLLPKREEDTNCTLRRET